MVRLAPILALLGASACDSTVIVEDPGAGGANGSSAISGSGTTSGSGSSSSGPMWTVPPDRVFSYVDCDYADKGTLLFVEVWKEGSACSAPPQAVDGILVLGIEGWDGQPGTFTLGVETPQGKAGAGMSPLMSEDIAGTLTVETFVGTPSAISWDLSVGAGRTDLSACGNFDAFPCE